MPQQGTKTKPKRAARFVEPERTEAFAKEGEA